MSYIKKIKEILQGRFISAELISETSNKVYKVKTNDGETLYAKFYEGNSSHIDNELKVYDLIDNKYLKELYYKSSNPKMAIFKELIGKTVDELTPEELENHSDKIVSSVCDYFNSIGKNKTNGYGLLDENLNGKYDGFYDFIKARQYETSHTLVEYKELSDLFDLIYDNYKDIMIPDNSLVPIDTNLKNIMILETGELKFSDPGEMISGPILMGYGDFVAHAYKTPLYDKLIEKLELDDNQEKLLRIYAIFSSLNILAFLKRIGVNELDKVIPFGNTYTFYELISEHLKSLGLTDTGLINDSKKGIHDKFQKQQSTN